MAEQKTTLRKLGDRRKELQHKLQWACFAFQHSKHINRATILFQHAKIVELRTEIARIDKAIRTKTSAIQLADQKSLLKGFTIFSSLQANTSKR